MFGSLLPACLRLLSVDGLHFAAGPLLFKTTKLNATLNFHLAKCTQLPTVWMEALCLTDWRHLSLSGKTGTQPQKATRR